MVFLNIHGLLAQVLFDIEQNLNQKVNAQSLAKGVAISPAHLQRLFRLAFDRPLAGYIRARKLAASLAALYKTNHRVVDIALEYGFEYEQSYIRAFKREYGLTPGEARFGGRFVDITPPLQLLNNNKMGDDLFFGPEIVMVPEFYVVGRRHLMPRRRCPETVPRVGADFFFNDWPNIPHKADGVVYIGLTQLEDAARSDTVNNYTPSTIVKKIADVPAGLVANTIPAGMYARFRYIGQHHYLEISSKTAAAMLEALDAYYYDEEAGFRLHPEMSFERIDEADYDGVFCKMEWFAPVTSRKLENKND